MTITTTPSLNALRETGTLNRKWHFWPVQILGNARAVVYLCGGLYLGGRFLYEGVAATPMKIHSIEKGLMVFTALALLLALMYLRRMSKIKKTLSGQLPTTITLDNNGINTVDAAGVSVFEPWSLYSSFRMGKLIAALTRADKKGFSAIPTDHLSPAESGQLRSILLSHLPEQ